MNGILAIAEGVGIAATANIKAQTRAALSVIGLMLPYLDLTSEWSKTLESDQFQYFADTMSTGSQHPENAGKAAQDYQKYTTDSAEMNAATGYLNTIIQTDKAVTKADGNSMSNIYQTEEPLTSVLKQIVTIILSPF